MIDFIQGIIEEITPTFVVINCNGVGYKANISLQTYTAFQNEKSAKVLTELIVREDAHLLFGFSDSSEKKVFKMLISVNGVGPASAMMMLSTLSIPEISNAIASGNSALLQKVKGIGLKTAQRIIIDLRDKVDGIVNFDQSLASSENKIKKETLSALEVLGISKKMVEKHVDAFLQSNPTIELEELIKLVLKKL